VQLTNFGFEGAKRSVMNGDTTFFYSFDQNNQFEGNERTLKIRLLQCYEVLWIHNIDAICISCIRENQRITKEKTDFLPLKNEFSDIHLPESNPQDIKTSPQNIILSL